MSLRNVQGVISGFCGLILVFFIGSIAFYKIMSMQDPSKLPAAWQVLYNALDSLYSLGLGVLIFLCFLCIFIPVLWIFMGRKNEERI